MTICAPATALGGAIAVIRLSGPQSLSIASAIFSKDLTQAPSHTVHYGNILDADGAVVDEVLTTVFRTPHSYTGEDSIEFSCHASRYIVDTILALLTDHGARLAKPGEFTQRAFLAGKMDLSQAEAVADLIASENKATHDIALSQLRGGFSSELARLRSQLLKLTSLLELELDFSEHEELEFASRPELLDLAQTIDQRVTQLADSFATGQAIKDGVPVAIVGKTNVGKSTLLNRLLHEERAIVSDIHGTTRDVIEDTIQLQGITFRFIDTAGIRQTTDTVEQMGIERTYQKLSDARLVIWVIDTPPSPDELADMTRRVGSKPLIIAHNKCDDPQTSPTATAPATSPPSGESEGASLLTVKISARLGHGIPDLEQAIVSASGITPQALSDVIVTNARHHEALLRAHDSLQRVITSLNLGISGDLVAEDLNATLAILGDITGGRISSQDTLNNIFQHFCIGK